MSTDKNKKKEIIDSLFKIMKDKANSLGFDDDMITEKDKHLVNDMVEDSEELLKIARALHQNILDKSINMVVAILKSENSSIGVTAVQQIMISYYRMRDTFLQNMLTIENDFHKYMITQILEKLKES